MKREIVNDSRYDAVGSSSLREELFNTFLKAQETSQLQSSQASAEAANSDADMKTKDLLLSEVDSEQRRKEKKERAIKEREEKIRAKRSKVEADIDKSRQGLHRGEDELEFRCAAYFTL